MDEKLEEIIPQINLDGIIKQVLDVISKANSLIDEYQKRLKVVEAREISIGDKEKEVNEKSNSISDRENNVKEIENTVELKNSAKKLMEEANSQMEILKKDKKDFESYKQGEDSRLAELRISQQKESDNIVRQRQSIEDDVHKQVTEFIEKFKQSKG